MKSVTISYAILVCNEYKELDVLLKKLLEKISTNDEIVIVGDKPNVTDKVKELIKFYSDTYYPIQYFENSLDGNFSQQKNFLFDKCTKEYIFNLDADEYPHESLLKNIKQILNKNKIVDLIYVPRVNVVKNITPYYLEQQNWKLDENGRINFPDLQGRIIKNNKKIKWEGLVHERLTGFDTFSQFPFENAYSIIHIKEFEKQQKQNEFYNQIITDYKNGRQ